MVQINIWNRNLMIQFLDDKLYVVSQFVSQKFQTLEFKIRV
jgi:hypothetical protein